MVLVGKPELLFYASDFLLGHPNRFFLKDITHTSPVALVFTTGRKNCHYKNSKAQKVHFPNERAQTMKKLKFHFLKCPRPLTRNTEFDWEVKTGIETSVRISTVELSAYESVR